jgi:hypothetical protein
MAKQTIKDIGWTEAQELNAKGWTIYLRTVADNWSDEYPDEPIAHIVLRPNMDELEFNEKVRAFMEYVEYEAMTFTASKG